MIVAEYSHISRLLNRIAKTLVKRRLTLSICESCTGGMLGSMITNIPGSSKYFLGGIIAYSNEVKEKVVGIRAKDLRKHGAVSAEVAAAMAKGVQEKLKSDIGIGITGIAGPTGGSKNKPVGLVYIAIAIQKKMSVGKYLFAGSRTMIRIETCLKSLLLLKKILSVKNPLYLENLTIQDI